MNKAAEINPMLKLGEQPLEMQMATALALTDALFGGITKVHKPTLEDKLDEVITMSRKITTLCRELKYTIPSEFDSALEESKLDAEGILTNFAAIRMHLDDRQRDGQLCDEA